MKVEEMSERIIQKLKLLPVDKIQKLGDSNLANFWEQYKEQLQYQLYLNYDIFEDNIKDLTYDEVNELSNKVIRQIFTSIASSYDPLRWVPKWERTAESYSPPATFEDKREHIVNTILFNIQALATSEEVVFEKTFPESKQEKHDN